MTEVESNEKEYLNDHVWVASTDLGLGVMAARQFLPNEAIGRVGGTIVRGIEHGSEYCMEIDAVTGLEPSSPFRYINHSCEPNCELIHIEPDENPDLSEGLDAPLDPELEYTLPEFPELWIEAIREIDPGEQLTIDYAWPAEGAIPCRCGTSKCRGWVVAEEEVDRMFCEVDDATRVPISYEPTHDESEHDEPTPNDRPSFE